MQFVLLCLPTVFVAMHVMSWAFVAAPPTITEGYLVTGLNPHLAVSMGH